MHLYIGSIDRGRFFTEYWRQKPILLNGAARRLAGLGMSFSRFHAIARQLRLRYPPLVFSPNNNLVFLQNMDLAADELRRVSMRLSRSLAGATVWFDGVYAADGRGIGSHYDIADAFVLQQKGVKCWRLHPPSIIPRSQLRLRMLNETNVDTVSMPKKSMEFRLEEGDALYLPLFWIHRGTSVDQTLSISLSFTARTLLSSLSHLLDNVGGPDGLRRELSTQQGTRRLEGTMWEASFPFTHVCQTAAVFEDRERASLRRSLSRHETWWRPLPLLRRNKTGPEWSQAARQVSMALAALRRELERS